jgi:hypothetical protein
MITNPRIIIPLYYFITGKNSMSNPIHDTGKKTEVNYKQRKQKPRFHLLHRSGSSPQLQSVCKYSSKTKKKNKKEEETNYYCLAT